MTVANAQDLYGIWQQRQIHYAGDHRDMDKLVELYEGILPKEFDDYFDPEMHVHVINMIRLAWDDLTTLSGKEFPLQVRPDNEKATAQRRAERQEQIGYGYNRAGRLVGGISMKLLMKVLAWWLVGCGNAVLMTLPDFKYKTPFFTFRDPRTHYPPVGWSPYTQAAPEDTMFGYQVTLGEAKRRYPAKSLALAEAYVGKSRAGKQIEADDSTMIWVGEYYHADRWLVVNLADKVVTLAQSETGDKDHPGVMPVRAFGVYSAIGAKGRSMFADQMSIQAAMARMFSQKLDFYDRTLYPIIFHTPLSGNVLKVGPLASNEFNMDALSGGQPRVDTIAPAHQVDADQTMAFAMGLSRMLNRNPESMQGQGEADSAKALNELKQGITSTVRDSIWPPMLEALPGAYSDAAQMDVNLWRNVSKRSRGTRKNRAFTVEYTPGTHLAGREFDFEIEPGLGLAGYQGTVELMQLVGAGMISLETALEQGEWNREPDEEKRRLQDSKLEDLEFADLAAMAQAGLLQPGAIPEIRRRVNEGAEDMYDVIAELDKMGKLRIQQPAAPTAGPAGPGGPAGGVPQEMPILPTMQAMGR